MTTMKQKYIDEVERHLEILLPTLEGKTYPVIAELLYHTVTSSEDTINLRERTAAVIRRQVNGAPNESS